MKRRVVVTGLGLVSPLGHTLEMSWSDILAGKSGIRTVTSFDPTDYPVQFAGEVPAFDMDPYIPVKDRNSS
ncbi:MAG: beta-ketoacyl-ACP synthase II, partial [Gammaproteobacteria bacterium]|nr:beta-ketoacyl-ACP synthase II [Gammaproteobacteria bacterium]